MGRRNPLGRDGNDGWKVPYILTSPRTWLEERKKFRVCSFLVENVKLPEPSERGTIYCPKEQTFLSNTTVESIHGKVNTKQKRKDWALCFALSFASTSHKEQFLSVPPDKTAFFSEAESVEGRKLYGEGKMRLKYKSFHLENVQWRRSNFLSSVCCHAAKKPAKFAKHKCLSCTRIVSVKMIAWVMWIEIAFWGFFDCGLIWCRVVPCPPGIGWPTFQSGWHQARIQKCCQGDLDRKIKRKLREKNFLSLKVP